MVQRKQALERTLPRNVKYSKEEVRPGVEKENCSNVEVRARLAVKIRAVVRPVDGRLSKQNFASQAY